MKKLRPIVMNKRAILNDRYELIKLIDQGGTAKVYAARDIQTRNRVAIKHFKHDFL